MATNSSNLKSRRLIKARITEIENYVFKKYSEDEGIENLTVRLDKLEDLYKKYEEIQNGIEETDPDGNHEEERLKIDNQHMKIKARIMKFQNECNKQLIANSNITNTSVNASSSELTKSKITIPEIQIPIFDGKYEEWRGFYDLFIKVIHENDSISNVEKLFYLRTSLKGEALKIIAGVSSSNENYEVALELLKDRYNNETYIVNSHIKALFDIPVVLKDNFRVMRFVISDIKQHLGSLKAFKVNIDNWDPLIVHMILQKIDAGTRRAWGLHKPAKTLATLDEFFKFLEHRCSSLEQSHQYERQENKFKQNKVKTGYSTNSCMKTNTNGNFTKKYKAPACKLCSEPHYLYHCKEFLQLSTEDRIQTIKINKYCYNCLRPNHSAKDCTSRKCTKCEKPHNTLLHINKVEAENTDTQVPNEENKLQISCYNAAEPKQVLLATVLLKIQDNQGNWHNARALLDSGSQCNFITHNLTDKLNLKSSSTQVYLSGIHNIQSEINRSTRVSISSRQNNYEAKLECLIVPEITCILPYKFVSYEFWNIPRDFNLADPTFNVPNPVDLLIGAEIYFEILKNEQWSVGNNLPIMRNTQFGWILSGQINQKMPQKKGSLQQRCIKKQTSLFVGFKSDLNKNLETFWQIEEIHTKSIMTKEQKECEKLYQESTHREQDGRYVVQLPLKADASELGNSYDLACQRFMSLHRKLQNNQELNKRYREFMNEYLRLHHMEVISGELDNRKPNYYIPHHAIFKESSSTTKLRVVFDASMKTTKNISLNDVLRVGPTVHQDIVSIALRFRLYRYVLTSDLEKMYRQIKIASQHTDLQRILWYKEDTNEIQTYKLLTVTYGTASAPYLATKTLKQLAKDEGCDFPLAKSVLENDFYVDDVLTGSNDLTTILKLQQELTELLARGKFNLHKWCSNSSEVLEMIETEKRETQSAIFKDKEAVKTLGLLWLLVEDKLRFMFNIREDNTSQITKRTILSEIASIYDPLGILGPVVVKAKLFIQRLWKEQIDWDSKLNSEIVSEWHQFKSQLQGLKRFEIDRRITNLNSTNLRYEIHGFSDASQIAYGACMYLKCIDEYKNCTIQLICAKSRVAPIKPITLPRLELCGALILSRLQQKVIEALNLDISAIYLWTDSTIVLHWISSDTTRWKIFVGNRVSEIQELTSNCTWNHVASNDNPADPLSRGLNADELQVLELWWHGPYWLNGPQSNWPQNNICNINKKDLEEKITLAVNVTIQNLNIFEKYSSLIKLKRIFAYCLRFINNIRNKGLKRDKNLTVDEINHALVILLKLAQREYFHKEIELLTKNQQIDNGCLQKLTPFLDSDGLLRVGGRLENLNINFNKKHPIILPSNHNLTNLIIQHEHLKLFHAGTQAVLGSLRENYWPIRARSTIRKLIHECITCYRLKTQQSKQLMGHLPAYRGEMTKPFTNTGLDYGGPFLMKQSSRKNSPSIKTYLALFIWLSTRAIHLEVVCDLSTEAFMNALRKFIARRGKCHTIYSDNATNFKGAKHQLHDLYQLFKTEPFQNDVINHAANQEINWRFIPPNAPHFGGIWEAGIKAVRHHLRRVIGNTRYTFEQFYTVITQIESCVNSRPLCPMSDDPSDYSYLTPAHFLLGSSPANIPEPQLLDTKENRLSLYQIMQKQLQSFWKLWSRDYLNTMQQRSKWSKISRNFPVGAIVLLREDNLPPSVWSLGRIIAVHPGADQLVRVVSVKTISGVYKRPITKLCLLPIKDNFEGDSSKGAECLETIK